MHTLAPESEKQKKENNNNKKLGKIKLSDQRGNDLLKLSDCISGPDNLKWKLAKGFREATFKNRGEH